METDKNYSSNEEQDNWDIITEIIVKIAPGFVVGKVVKITMQWVVSKVKMLLAFPDVLRVAVIDIRKIVAAIQLNEVKNNSVKIHQLEKLLESGATHILAGVNKDGVVLNIDVFSAEETETDVTEYLDRTGEGMIVICG